MDIRMRPAAVWRCLAVEQLAHLAGEVLLGEGLVQELHVGIEAPLMHDGVAGVAGGEQHGQIRVDAAGPCRRAPPIRAAQHDVGEQRLMRGFLATARSASCTLAASITP